MEGGSHTSAQQPLAPLRELHEPADPVRPPARPPAFPPPPQRWRIADLTGLNSKGAEAQEFVCNLPARIRRLAERKTGEAGGLLLGCCCCPPCCVHLPASAAAEPARRAAHQSPRHRIVTAPAERKAKTKKEPVRFSWLYDRPIELHYNEMTTARTRGTAAAAAH